MENKSNLIEALIFASDVPLPSRKIKEILDDSSESEVKKIIKKINQKYEEIKSPFEIVEIAGGFQMVTRPEYGEWVRKLYLSRTKSRLTERALETLAIIAYKQPITKAEIESIRGVNIDTVLRTLIERKLITIMGREKAPGNPLLYGTTKYFLEYFGLKEISDLPKLKEIDELMKGDQKFLESLDQVSLKEILPEELGISSMIQEKLKFPDAEVNPSDENVNPREEDTSDANSPVEQ